MKTFLYLPETEQSLVCETFVLMLFSLHQHVSFSWGVFTFVYFFRSFFLGA